MAFLSLSIPLQAVSVIVLERGGSCCQPAAKFQNVMFKKLNNHFIYTQTALVLACSLFHCTVCA